MMPGISLKIAALTCAAALTFGSAAQAADVVVMDSSVASIAAGSIVPDSASVDIPAGGAVVLIMADGETRSVIGPYSGPIGAAQSSGDALAQSNAGSDTKVLGAVRAPKWEQSN